MRTKFRGWTSVYGFSFKQATKTKAFRITTILICLILILGIGLVNILVAKPSEEVEVEPSLIKTIHVLDESGLAPTDFKNLNPAFHALPFNEIEFITSTESNRESAIKAIDEMDAILLWITETEGEYQFELIIPEESDISVYDAEEVLEPLKNAFEANKLLQAGLSEEQLTAITRPIISDYRIIGETVNQIQMIIQMVAPMIFGLVLYMMLVIYGQTVSKSISTEKTSKLMETLLTSVHPYAMITGKVLATTSVAILQFLTWGLSIVLGLLGGNLLAQSIFPGYESNIGNVIEFIRDHLGESALSISSILMALLFFVIGFVFYCVIAALAGAMVSKPEDVASTQSLFQLPIVFSWLLSYLSPVIDVNWLTQLVRYFPFTSPFRVPVDILTGAMSFGESLLSFGLLLIFSFLVIVLSARIYKGLVLYHGQKINFKTIYRLLRNN